MRRSRYRMALVDGHRVRVVRHQGIDGFIVHWTASCSGCLESEDGRPVGRYPFDAKARCSIGAGCSECGYTGKRRQSAWVPLDPAAFDRATRAAA